MSQPQEAYRLKEGTKLRYPIRDADGNYAVHAGTLVTARLISLLEQRGMRLSLRACLKVIQGARIGQEIPVGSSKLLIGRGKDCNIRPRSTKVSNRHCMIYLRSYGLFVKDLRSTNGTFVNRMRMQPTDLVELNDGDILSVGDMAFQAELYAALDGDEGAQREVKQLVIADARGQVAEPEAGKTGGIDSATIAEFHRLLRGMPEGNEEYHRLLKSRSHVAVADPRFPNSPTIIVADDSAEVRRAFIELLTSRGWKCHEASDGPSLTQRIAETAPDVIQASCDMLRAESGLFLRAIRSRRSAKNFSIVGFINALDAMTAQGLIRQGVGGFIILNDFRMEAYLEQMGMQLAKARGVPVPSAPDAKASTAEREAFRHRYDDIVLPAFQSIGKPVRPRDVHGLMNGGHEIEYHWTDGRSDGLSLMVKVSDYANQERQRVLTMIGPWNENIVEASPIVSCFAQNFVPSHAMESFRTALREEADDGGEVTSETEGVLLRASLTRSARPRVFQVSVNLTT